MELSAIGKRVALEDAYEKVTGKLKFAVDISLPGMLHAKVLRSEYAHARIMTIDTSRAEELPGVEAVVTAKDAPDVLIGRITHDYTITKSHSDFTSLDDDPGWGCLYTGGCKFWWSFYAKYPS